RQPSIRGSAGGSQSFRAGSSVRLPIPLGGQAFEGGPSSMGPLGLFGSRPGRTPTPGPRPRADSGDKNPQETSCEPRIRRTNRRPESGNAGGGAEARGAPASPAGSSKALTPGRAVGAEPQRRRQRSRSSGRPTGGRAPVSLDGA